MIAARMRQRSHRTAGVAAVFVAVILATGSRPASAHAELVGTTPKAGTRVGTAPGAVVLTFSETMEPRLSKAVVTTPDGGRVTGPGSGTRITVPLTTNAPGVYRVAWKVVSADDGHTTTGSFQFSVATTPDAAAAGGSGTPAWQSVLFATG